MTRLVLALLLVVLAFGCVEGHKDTPLRRDGASLRDRPEGASGRSASTHSVSSEKP